VQIIGNGMLARSLYPYQERFLDDVAFAGGVADSQLTDEAAYARERALLQATLNDCGQNGKRILYFSSAGAIYGSTEDVRDESTPLQPQTRYGEHKLHCETLIRESGVRYLIVRLANLVGAGQNQAQLIPALFAQVKTGRVVVQALATRDILDVNDFAHILSRLIPIVPDREVIVVASGVSVPVPDLVAAIQDISGQKARVELVQRGNPQRISIAKLQQLLPDIRFGADYFRDVIQNYVSAVTDISETRG
jgi:nucleoside-diphosphate-sugar epimerase